MGGLFAAFASAVLVGTARSQDIRFNRDIRPILSENCFACHGPDSGHRKAGLRLDMKGGLFDRREHGFAIVPGKPGESLIVRHITASDPDELMPPPKSGKKLSAAQKSLFTKWIEQGADWEPLWSFVAPTRPALPVVGNEQWCRNPIDRFVLARLEAAGLQPAPEADRSSLIRRVTFDLTGLPPKADDVEAFVDDPSPDAYEKVVDRLLASPQYGEHRARYWLDAARYADTHGIHNDNYVELWPYRDWVIEAFNRNEPFDQFVVEQIAGDLLPHPTLDQQVATGFHRCTITTGELGSIDDEVLAMYARERAETTGQVFMGLTVGCAVCHDHKFDPIRQKDFYELTAFFRNTPQPALDGNLKDTPPVIVVPSEADRPRWAQEQKTVAELSRRVDETKRQVAASFANWAKSDGAGAISEPIDPADECLALPLDAGDGDRAAFTLDGREDSVPLPNVITWGTGPAGNNAIHFGANEGVQIPGAGDVDADRPLSIGLWVLAPKDQSNHVLAGKIDAGPKHPGGWVLEIDKGIATFKLSADGSEKPLQARAAAGAKVAAGKWAHVLVTYDGSRRSDGLALFVDGKPQPSRPGENVVLKGSTHSDAPLRIGSDGKRGLNGGAVHDVRIYRRALLPEEVAAVHRWPELRNALVRVGGKLSDAERKDFENLYLVRFDSDYRKLAVDLNRVRRDEEAIRQRSPVAAVMVERPNSVPKAHVLFRGQYDQPKEEVIADTPAFLPPLPKGAPHNRLGLAEWIVAKDNPLTARVTVNRFWQEVFGEGIVRTPGDFGIMGENPSHPQLLDWLACEFRDGSTGSPQAGSTGSPQAAAAQAWDVKHMLKLMVMSATYRQAAVTTPQKLQKDPDNRLLSRGPRFRLDAEELRDAVLAESGLLVEKIGGPSVKPYQPPGVWEAVAMYGSNTRFYKQDSGEGLYRRSMYWFWKRSAPPASLDIFNAPSRETCTIKRERTDTPLQALVAMNDPQWVEAARALATRALRDVPSDTDKRLDFITDRVLARTFDPREREICKRSLRNFTLTYEQQPEEATKLIATGESKPDASLPAAELASWTMLASQIMNLDEALNK
ncbi:MAG TPA: DUF1553 domain-containing protein [Tepidisphaeraceae bacterium]